MIKKYFDNPRSTIRWPLNPKQISFKEFFEGLGVTNKQYHLKNDIAEEIFSKLLKDNLTRLYYYSTSYQNSPAEEYDIISEIDSKNNWESKFTKTIFLLCITNEGTICLRSEKCKKNDFERVANALKNFITNGGLVNYIKGNHSVQEYFFSNTENLLGNPTYITTNFQTNETCSLLFRELKVKELNAFHLISYRIQFGRTEDDITHTAFYDISYSLRMSTDKYFIDISPNYIDTQIKRFKSNNISLIKITEQRIQSSPRRGYPFIINSPNDIFRIGKKYKFNVFDSYSFIYILINDLPYILWLMKTHNNFIIEKIQLYYKYFIPITDDIAFAVICNEIKLNNYRNLKNEETESFNYEDLKWMNDATFEFDDDNYWNID